MSRDGGLRPMFRKMLPRFFWVVIETPVSGGGVPDHYWCCAGISGWNEYKLAKGNVVNFRPEQIGWHQAHARHGGRSFIVIRKTGRGVDHLYIYKGDQASHTMLTLSAPLLRLEGGPGAWDWSAIDSSLVK